MIFFLITVDGSSGKLDQSSHLYITLHIYWLWPLSDSQHKFSPCDDGKWTWESILHYKRKTFNIHYITPQDIYPEKQSVLRHNHRLFSRSRLSNSGFVSILCLYNKRMMEMSHISIRESPDFVLLKPLLISVDSFCKWQNQASRHALSSWQRPAGDDPKPETVRWFYISEEKWGIVASFGHRWKSKKACASACIRVSVKAEVSLSW